MDFDGATLFGRDGQEVAVTPVAHELHYVADAQALNVQTFFARHLTFFEHLNKIKKIKSDLSYR